MRFSLCIAVTLFLAAPAHRQLAAEPPAAEAPVINALDRAKLLSMEGKEVIVEGKVVHIGHTENHGINFLNFSFERDAFVALIYNRDLAEFPDGLEPFVGKQVRVRGEIIVYQEKTPEIKVSSASQIELVKP